MNKKNISVCSYKHRKTNRYLKESRTHYIYWQNLFRYFDKNNIWFFDSMRETKLRYKAYLIWDKAFFDVEDFDMNTCIRELRTELNTFKKILKYMKPEVLSYGNRDDYKLLCYISDRWFSYTRLYWLIDLLERNCSYVKTHENDNPEKITWVHEENI